METGWKEPPRLTLLVAAVADCLDGYWMMEHRQKADSQKPRGLGTSVFVMEWNPCEARTAAEL